jgi:hydroxymethylpyrimidine pyrophosphatase-like HAD family hydrolase
MVRCWAHVGRFIVDPDCASPTWHPVLHPVRNLTNEREQLALADEIAQNHAAALIPVRNSRLLSLRHPLSRKGFALAHLVEHLGLLMSQAVAVGDSLNDLTMLDGSCGNLTAAVPNADPLVLAATQAAGGILLEEPATLGVASLFEALVAASSLRR